MIYKFMVDFRFKKEVEKFLIESNLKTEFKCIKPPYVVKLDTENEKEVFKLHNFFIRLHQIDGNAYRKDILEPQVVVSLNFRVSSKIFYFDYSLGSLFCQILKEGNISFTPAKITINALRNLDTIPVWITEKDFSKVEKLISGSQLGHPYLTKMYRNIFAEI